MDAYKLHEARFLQFKSGGSAAAGLYAQIGPVPANRVWTLLGGLVKCSVAETQDYWFSVLRAGVEYFPITQPREAILDPATNRSYPLLTEGMEIKLFPGEYLYAFRDAATAGSVITLWIRFVEADLPYYEYEEPLKRAVVQPKRHSSLLRAAFGPGVGGGGGAIDSGRGEGGLGGGGGGSEPI